MSHSRVSPRKAVFLGALALTAAVLALVASGGSRVRAGWKQDWTAYQQITRTIDQERKFTEAEKQIRALLERQPDAYILHWRLGYTLASQTRHMEALAAYERARQLNPFLIRDGIFLMLLGESQLQAGDRERAKAYFKASLEAPQLSAQLRQEVQQTLDRLEKGGAR